MHINGITKLHVLFNSTQIYCKWVNSLSRQKKKTYYFSEQCKIKHNCCIRRKNKGYVTSWHVTMTPWHPTFDLMTMLASCHSSINGPLLNRDSNKAQWQWCNAHVYMSLCVCVRSGSTDEWVKLKKEVYAGVQKEECRSTTDRLHGRVIIKH